MTMRVNALLTTAALGFYLIFFVHIPAEASIQIEEGKSVKLHYSLIVDGKVVRNTEEEGPVRYIQGAGEILPALEDQLMGLEVGDTVKITLTPENAYGLINPNAILEVPRTHLPKGELWVGRVLDVTTDAGEQLNAVVKEIRENVVLVDFNHPLAGKELLFNIEVLEVTQ
jgi:FKBP-type peptidyl-prolyl cis-trans isomerase SlyD